MPWGPNWFEQGFDTGYVFKDKIEKPYIIARFYPERSKYAECCRLIGHVQEYRIKADGRVLSPGKFQSNLAYQNKWSLNGWTVDTARDEKRPEPFPKSPFYQDVGVGGFGRIDFDLEEYAWMKDRPFTLGGDKFFYAKVEPPKDPRKENQKGWHEVTLEFKTFAACKSGQDCPRFYEGFEWQYTRTTFDERDNKGGKITITAPIVPQPDELFLLEYER
jgi:hypothetical protein